MNDTATAGQLRAAMIARIIAHEPTDPHVQAAMRAVPRHAFVPHAPLDAAYSEDAVITHTGPDGTALSCASEPRIVAAMLTALQTEPGQHILEIGAGTGYNAALLDTLVGGTGHVVTVDIDPHVTTEARQHLDHTGHRSVTVLTHDGAHGADEYAPYQRAIVTVGAYDIPHTWWDQMTPGGRLVVPLRFRGTTRALALVKEQDRWVADWDYLCGFVPMIGQDTEHTITLDPGRHVTIHHDPDQTIDPAALHGVLNQNKTTLWSHITVAGDEPFDRIWLHLAATHPGTARIHADPEAIHTGLCTPAIPIRSPALVHQDSLAYFTIRPATPGRWELGATGHGPHRAHLTHTIIDQIRAWDRDRAADPHITIHPSPDAPTSSTEGQYIRKAETTLHLHY